MNIVISPVWKLYQEPDCMSTIADEVFSGMQVEVLDEVYVKDNSSKILQNAREKGQSDHEFVYVKTEYGYQGWGKKNGICKCSRQQEDELSRGCARGMVCARSADVYLEPNVKSKVCETLFAGSFLMELSPEEDVNGFIPVRRVNGIKGYVYDHALRHAPKYRKYYMKESNIEQEIEIERENVVRTALSFLGVPYRYGGKTVLGLDCSGLCWLSYYINGIIIYRDAKLMDGFPVYEISPLQLKPADLLYFPGHMAMYIGNGRYIHATGRSGDACVRINSLNECDFDYRHDLAESLYAVGRVDYFYM